MDRSSIITLISYTRTQDSTGVWRDGVETRRNVFCSVESVSRAEFFAAGQIGLRPDYLFTVFFGDYAGESLCEYNGARYSIYRTYHARTDVMELYAQREVGVHG